MQLVHPVVSAGRATERRPDRCRIRRPLSRRPARGEGGFVIARVRHAVVLGAGTMGAQLACLRAGAGARVTLLDIDSATAAKGLERAVKTRPAPLYRSIDTERIDTAGFDHLAPAVRAADWVLEAIVEQLEPKRALLALVDEALTGRADWPLVST